MDVNSFFLDGKNRQELSSPRISVQHIVLDQIPKILSPADDCAGHCLFSTSRGNSTLDLGRLGRYLFIMRDLTD